MCGVPDWVKDAGKFVAYGPAAFALGKVTGIDPVDTVGNILFPPGVPKINAPPTPPPPPDMTDEEVQKARAAMVRRQLMGQGTASTFLTGPLGDLTTAPILKPSAGGT